MTPTSFSGRLVAGPSATTANPTGGREFVLGRDQHPHPRRCQKLDVAHVDDHGARGRFGGLGDRLLEVGGRKHVHYTGHRHHADGVDMAFFNCAATRCRTFHAYLQVCLPLRRQHREFTGQYRNSGQTVAGCPQHDRPRIRPAHAARRKPTRQSSRPSSRTDCRNCRRSPRSTTVTPTSFTCR